VAAGLVLVRQKRYPQRASCSSPSKDAAGMIAVQDRIQREGEVVHLTADLAGVGDRDMGFPLLHGRGDEFHHGSPGIDPRSLPPKVTKPRDIYEPTCTSTSSS
jgi:hypothetical protein